MDMYFRIKEVENVLGPDNIRAVCVLLQFARVIVYTLEKGMMTKVKNSLCGTVSKIVLRLSNTV